LDHRASTASVLVAEGLPPPTLERTIDRRYP